MVILLARHKQSREWGKGKKRGEDEKESWERDLGRRPRSGKKGRTRGV
jgi:hypothetical protein